MALAADHRQGCTGTLLPPGRHTDAMFDRLSHAIAATQALVASGRDLCARSDVAMQRSRQSILRTMAILDAARHHRGRISPRVSESPPRR